MTVAGVFSVAWAVARQDALKLRQVPAKLVPPILLPLFMFAAFGGALGAVGNTPGFAYYNYTAFVFVFVVYMASMFAAVFTTFDIAADFQAGFGARMMLAVPRRMAIVVGYLIVALARGLLGIGVVFAVAVVTGMPVQGGAADIALLVVLALLLNVATTLYGAGIALRFQSTSCGVLILIPSFMVFFVAPIFIPRPQLTGWLRTAADVNPLTPVLEAGRGFLAGDPVKVGLGFAAAAGLIAVFGLWAATGLRRAERGPSERPSRRRGQRGPHGRGPRARRARAHARRSHAARAASKP